jgi:hypothetical protein
MLPSMKCILCAQYSLLVFNHTLQIEVVAGISGHVIGSASDIASVSSLGSQVNGSSTLVQSVQKDVDNSGMADFKSRLEDEIERLNLRLARSNSLPSNKEETAGLLIELQRSYEVIERLNSEEPGDAAKPTPSAIQRIDSDKPSEPVKLGKSRTADLLGNVLTPESIAELELKARERYILASQDHRKLQQTGVKPDSKLFKKSEKNLRDCYAQIEYWECLGEERSGMSSKDSREVKVLKAAFGRKDPKTNKIDVDAEETKARDDYLYAMLTHQGLVNSGVSTTSEKWNKSLKQLEDSLAAFQYWEGRREFVVSPQFVKSRPKKT